MIIQLSDLQNIREKYKNKKIVAASGVFDLLHIGHVQYLQSLKNYGDTSVVLVKPDDRIRHLKQFNRPIIPEADRARMVDSIKGIDYVVIGSSLLDKSAKVDAMYKEFFVLLEPDIFVSANDHWGKLADITNTKIHIVPRYKTGRYESTTAILKHISNLDSF